MSTKSSEKPIETEILPEDFQPIIDKTRAAFGRSALNDISDVHVYQFHKKAQHMYAIKAQAVYQPLAEMLCGWGYFPDKTPQKIATMVKKVCLRLFGHPPKFTPAPGPSDTFLQEWDRQENRRGKKKEIDLDFDPMDETVKLIRSLWCEYDFWCARTREDHIERKSVVGIASLLRETIKDAKDLSNSPAAGLRRNQLRSTINIEQLQIGIQRNVQDQAKFGELLDILTEEVESIPEMVEASVEYEDQLPQEKDTQIRSDGPSSSTEPQTGTEKSVPGYFDDLF
jgi:hypothetical protein